MYSELLSEIISNSKIEFGKDFSKSKIYNFEHNLTRERFDIKTDMQEKLLNKSKGRYELFSLPEVLFCNKKQLDYFADEISKILKEMIGRVSSKSRILIVGLGNRHISSDSLGTKVVSNINITFDSKHLPKVMAFCPSVMGLTGIETYDTIMGVVDKTKPDFLIVIDSLCASDSSRLGRSIQLTTTGICPGSGIGNKRKCIDENIGCKVFSIGIPLLIYAGTFVTSSFHKNSIDLEYLNSIMQISKKCENYEEISHFIENVKNVYQNVDDMIVSTKDIEEIVKILAGIVGKSINNALGI